MTTHEIRRILPLREERLLRNEYSTINEIHKGSGAIIHFTEIDTLAIESG
jgi:hypothetical protein